MADSAATPNDNAQEQKPQRSGKRKLFLLLLLCQQLPLPQGRRP